MSYFVSFCLLGMYQIDMMRNLRHVNIDHLHVGWYQSTQYGTFLNKQLLDSQYNYQHSIEESVVIIYGKLAPRRTNLLRKALKFCRTILADKTADKGEYANHKVRD